MQRRLLLSAFGCLPNWGSEPGVGWAWALGAAALGDDVSVITVSSGRKAIEAYFEERPCPPNLHFIFVDEVAERWPGFVGRILNNKLRFYQKNLIWQWRAYRTALALHRFHPFDAVHHVTVAAIRAPSFMGRLGIPFIFGPLGGGESAPWRLRWSYGWQGFVFDAIRDLSNLAIRWDPLMRQSFRQATKIYVTTQQTREIIPARWRHKTEIELAIGCDEGMADAADICGTSRDTSTYKILFVGRLLDWKGMSLGLRAFAELVKKIPEARLVIVGGGPAENRWRRLADRLGIGAHVTWIRRIPHDRISETYHSHDVLLFPSLHDSGGMVVLEAMLHGLPVVCLDLGGPGTLIDNACGRVVTTRNLSARGACSELCRNLFELRDAELRAELGARAKQKARTWNWSQKISNIIEGTRINQGQQTEERGVEGDLFL